MVLRRKKHITETDTDKNAIFGLFRTFCQHFILKCFKRNSGELN